MEKGVFIKDIEENCRVAGAFVTRDPSQGLSRNGPFWKLTLADNSGSLEAKIWPPLSADFANIAAGAIARVTGRASRYREQLQITIDSFEPLSEEETREIDAADFMPASSRDIEEMFKELRLLCLEEFKYPPWRKLALAALNDADLAYKFKTMPAAKSVHHAYVGGLLEHTLGVFKLCEAIADHYPELDRQTLLAGALFHDFGKIREFSGGFANDYTNEGRLVGHIFLGLEMLAPLARKCGLKDSLLEHFAHLILSHHGEPEFGAAKRPQTPEALALHYADNLDAKLAQCRALFANMEQNEWSAWQKTLDRAMFHPARTPEGKDERKSGRGDNLCLSLLKE